MNYTEPRHNLKVWGQDNIEWATIDQAAKTAVHPYVAGPVALMPDAHVGLGSTVGSVIPTKGAVIPAAIGVDIGCGMAAVKTNLTKDQLPPLDNLMPDIARAVPAGVGQAHEYFSVNIEKALGWAHVVADDSRLKSKAEVQCGTLGSGNHFFEICLDESDNVWIVLHSGSRGVGNEIAQFHIKKSKELLPTLEKAVEDKDLAYFLEGTQPFDDYIHDMLWAQDYAALNREVMLNRSFKAFKDYVLANANVKASALDVINCHHNFTERETFNDESIWVTRKGAIKADVGDKGIIPGSMGTSTYIVSGLGNAESYNSCSHGAGRVYSRSKAKQVFSTDDLRTAMAGKVWNENNAKGLVDEIPGAYKDIDAVVAAQSDLVSVEHVLTQIFNYKG